MAEERKEKWLSILALSTVILAVCATLSTFKGGSFSTRSVMAQSQASNQWSYYQSKSIKSYQHELQKENLELELKTIGPGASKSLLEEYQKKIAEYTDTIKRYDSEMADIQKDAKRLESLRNDAQKHSQIFGMAIVFLQIAILLSSIAALTKRKSVWYVGLASGLMGLIYFFNGFFLFIS
ncbi:MAG: DUF4337 domain-containing protein [Candidatus Omnitrophica bacterium]|nr:DUF4337 domain-containing protein [Candidatus Omnitrophota bacterium]